MSQNSDAREDQLQVANHSMSLTGEGSIQDDDAADSDWHANGMSASSEEGSEGQDANSDEDYDSSRPEGRRKRKAKQNGPPKRPRVDTLMTRKLRSAPQLVDDEPGESAKPSEPSDADRNEPSDLDEDMDDLPLDDAQAEPVRELSDEQVREDLAKVQSMWEMGSILSFLHLFLPYLKLNVEISSSGLELALVKDAGPGLLADLHMDLLRGCTKGINISASNWAYHVARKLIAEHQYCVHKHEVLLPLSKGAEGLAYAALPVETRVRILKAVCEMRLMRDDLRNLVDGTTARKDKKKDKNTGVEYNVDDYRWHMFGKDSEGNAYWLYDPGPVEEARLYCDKPNNPPAKAQPRETPEPASRGKGRGRGRGRGKSKAVEVVKDWTPAETDECFSTWSLLCDGPDAMAVEVSKLYDTGHRTDLILAKKLDEIVSRLEQTRQTQERKRKTVARRQAALATPFTDWSAISSSGRPQRQRKVINYAFTDYDQEIKDAIRTGEVLKQLPPPSSRTTRRSQQVAQDGGRGETRTMSLRGDGNNSNRSGSPLRRNGSLGEDSPRTAPSRRRTVEEDEEEEEREEDYAGEEEGGGEEEEEANGPQNDEQYEPEQEEEEEKEHEEEEEGKDPRNLMEANGGYTRQHAFTGAAGNTPLQNGQQVPPFASSVHNPEPCAAVN